MHPRARRSRTVQVVWGVASATKRQHWLCESAFVHAIPRTGTQCLIPCHLPATMLSCEVVVSRRAAPKRETAQQVHPLGDERKSMKPSATSILKPDRQVKHSCCCCTICELTLRWREIS